MNMLVGIGVMWAVAQIPPQKLMRFAVPLYVLGVILLVLASDQGQRCPALVVDRLYAHPAVRDPQDRHAADVGLYFHKHEAAPAGGHFVVAALLLLVPFGLIAKQPDLGTAILVGAAGFYVIFFAGLPWKIIFGMVALAAGAAPFAWNMLHDYQQKRIPTLIDPTTDPLGAGYHIIQSTIAIGSGGSFGKGWLQGTQTHLEFIPERHTDFVFAVFSEERGLLGNSILTGLYLLLIIRVA